VSAPPIVMGDNVQAQCAIHLVPNPSSGAPQPAPPMPFSAPLLQGLAQTVTIGGKGPAVVGSQGMNTPPHVGLHPSDPFMAPPSQTAVVISGSPTVFVEGKPIATQQSQATCCGMPGGTALPTITNVTVD
jgi:uncharacterized Zn-binding protein involved in type VI secretion